MHWCLWDICSLFAQLVLPLSVFVIPHWFPPALLGKTNGLSAESSVVFILFPLTVLLNVTFSEL